jgi:hypothetical protein
MQADRSELASMSSLLDQLTRRIASMGEKAAKERHDEEAKELFGIERALAAALRRVERLLNPKR